MSYHIPTDEQLRRHVVKEIQATGLTKQEYANRKGVSLSGLQKFIFRARGATLDFAAKLVR